MALHGRGGEDGTVQEILEIVGMPYTGSGVPACIRSMDKVLTKHLLIEQGLPTPDFFAFNETAFREFGAAEALPAIEERLGFPIVVKPAAQGSALGIKFARSPEDVPEALIAAFSYDDKVLLERYVDGRELAVGLLEQRRRRASAAGRRGACRRRSTSSTSRRATRSARPTTSVPPSFPPTSRAAAQELAVAIYRLLGCYGFARVDMILSKDGEPQVLEGQAIPGLTETSLLPQAAEAAGLSFEQLIERLVEQALARPGATQPERLSS